MIDSIASAVFQSVDIAVSKWEQRVMNVTDWLCS